MVRLLEFDELGHIVVPDTKVLTKFKVRFPSAKEQAKGMTEVPRELRRKKTKRAK